VIEVQEVSIKDLVEKYDMYPLFIDNHPLVQCDCGSWNTEPKNHHGHHYWYCKDCDVEFVPRPDAPMLIPKRVIIEDV
jgi:hypothetical protein